MKNKIYQIAIAFTAILFTLSSCKKEKVEEPENQTGQITVSFTHVFGSASLPFSLNTQFIHPKTGDTLTYSTFKYYVSNLKFRKSDGTWWSEPESYHLVDVSVPSSLDINIKNLPAATYTAMEYTMGVDSLRNVSGAQTGALSITNSMFWSWNSGYIMVKAEGASPNSSTGSFAYHLGGFSGQYNIVTVKTADFSSQAINVNKDKSPKLIMQANTGRLWHTLTGVDAINTIHMPGADAKQAATDFYGSVALKAVEQ